MKRYHLLDERKFRHFCQGLTFDAKDMEVLDQALRGLDEKTAIPSKIVAHNGIHGFGPPPAFSGPEIIVNVEKHFSETKTPFSFSTVVRAKSTIDAAPAIHINLSSPALDIHQRVEIPMRYLLKGLPKIEDTYMVYLHALKMEDGSTFVYYGITKRGWVKRFNEHMYSALSQRSRLLFHQVLREGI